SAPGVTCWSSTSSPSRSASTASCTGERATSTKTGTASDRSSAPRRARDFLRGRSRSTRPGRTAGDITTPGCPERFCSTRSGLKPFGKWRRRGIRADMGIPVSLVLIAAGAILAFAVHQNEPNPPVDIDVVGWVLLLVGLFGLLLSLLLWERWAPGQFGW